MTTSKWNFEQCSPSASRPRQLACDLSQVAIKAYHPVTRIKTPEPGCAALRKWNGDESLPAPSPYQHM